MSTVDTLLRWSPLQPATAWSRRERPAVLGFHGVDDPDQFATLMDHVGRHYRPITIQQLDHAIHRNTSLPRRSVLVTFDDGHRSVLEHGLPILRERGIPAVAFVVAGLIDTDTDYWWSTVDRLAADGVSLPGREDMTAAQLVRHLKEVPDSERRAALDEMAALAGSAPPRAQLTAADLATLRAGGIDIGNHTWSHPCLDRCSDDVVRDEIVQAHDTLTRHLGDEPRWFAYPNGNWSECAEDELRRLGYTLGFKFDHRHLRPTDDPLRLSRLRANSDATVNRLAIILSGLHPQIHQWRHDLRLANGPR